MKGKVRIAVGSAKDTLCDVSPLKIKRSPKPGSNLGPAFCRPAGCLGFGWRGITSSHKSLPRIST
jgi:hypothetical protein